MGATTSGSAALAPPSRRSRCPTSSGRAGDGRRLGAVRPDRRRPHRRPGAPAGAPAAVRAVAGAAGVDDAGAHPPRRRPGRVSSRRGEPFPRHWVYDADGTLAAKTGLTDFKDWCATAFGRHTPWGDEDSPALVTAVETALERALSMQSCAAARSRDPQARRPVHVLVRQGDPAQEIFLLLDGVIRSTGRRRQLAEVGPGRHARRAGRARGRHPHVHPRRGHRRAGSPRSAPASSTWPTLAELATGHRREDERRRRRLSVRVHLLRRPRLDARAGRGVRPVRRPHLVRGRRPGDGPTTAPDGCILDAGTGICAGHRRCSAARRSRRHPPHPPALGPHPGPAVLRGRRPRRRPGHACCCPNSQTEGSAGAEEVLAGRCRRRTSRSARTGCGGTWTFGSHGARRVQDRGLRRCAAQGGPAQGRPHLRLPGQRRAFGDRLHARPLPHRARARPGRLGRVPPRRAGPGRRAWTC